MVKNIDDIAYFQGCTTGSLLSQLGWREDLLRHPRDFPATGEARIVWRHQTFLIRRELRRRGVESDPVFFGW